MHKDQIDVSVGTARSLVDDQFPQWSRLSIRRLSTAATVNTIFRLGDELTVRFPLGQQEPVQARARLAAEAEASSEFASASPFPSPRPVALGDPGHGYPLSWSVQTWIPGQDALGDDPADSLEFANGLADLLAALRGVDTIGRRFSGTGRGGHLTDHDQWMDVCFRRSEGHLDVRPLRELWDDLRTVPEVDEDVMTHGDLTPPNLLVHRSLLAGVLDTGGFAAADPALDLVSVWHLLNQTGREVVRERLGCGDVQWLRGMAWTFLQAMGLVWYYADTNPVMSRWGRRSLDRLRSAPEIAP